MCDFKVKNLKAVLFDLDGTITISDPIHFAVFKKLLKEKLEMELSQEMFDEKIHGRNNDAIMNCFFPDNTKQEHLEFIELKETMYRKEASLPGRLTSISGFMDFLEMLKNKSICLAVVTNAPRKNAELALTTLGLTNYFGIIVTADDVEKCKPDPFPYQKALKFFNVNPDEAVVFEDSPSGIKAGIAAGVATIGLSTGQPADSLLKLGVEFTIEDYNDKKLDSLKKLFE